MRTLNLRQPQSPAISSGIMRSREASSACYDPILTSHLKMGCHRKEVRIIELRAEPWPEDGRRVRIHLEVTPFLERPNLEVPITDASSAGGVQHQYY